MNRIAERLRLLSVHRLFRRALGRRRRRSLVEEARQVSDLERLGYMFSLEAVRREIVRRRLQLLLRCLIAGTLAALTVSVGFRLVL